MIKLISSDLRDHARIWIGAFIIAVICGYLGGWAASLQATTNFYATDPSLHTSLQNTVSMVLSFSSIAAVAVLTSTANLTVSAQRRSYALWQLANVSPRLVRTVVLVQVMVVALVGSLCGSLLAAASFVPLFPVIFSPWEPFAAIIPRVELVYLPVVWLVTGGIFLLGGLKGARSAGNTPPLVALRDPEPKRQGITWFRVVLFVGMSAATAAVVFIMSNAQPEVVMNYSMYLPLIVVASLVPLAPAVCSVVLRAWTKIVPQKHWNAWYVARTAARYGLSSSASVETPVMVGFGLIAGIYSVMNLWEQYMRGQGMTTFNGLDATQTILVLGGPVLLCAAGAAVSVVMTSKSRTRDVALLVASGDRPQTLLASAVCEAGIHTVTATLVGMAAVVLSNALVAHAVGLPLFEGLTFGEGIAVSLAGFILVLVATVVPTYQALGCEPASILARQE